MFQICCQICLQIWAWINVECLIDIYLAMTRWLGQAMDLLSTIFARGGGGSWKSHCGNVWCVWLVAGWPNMLHLERPKTQFCLCQVRLMRPASHQPHTSHIPTHTHAGLSMGPAFCLIWKGLVDFWGNRGNNNLGGNQNMNESLCICRHF